MNKYILSDLACEISENNNTKEDRLGEKIVKKAFYSDIDGDKKFFVTFFTPKMWLLTDTEYFLLKEAITDEILMTLERFSLTQRPCRILVVGIGNPRLTTDSLGVQTVEKIFITSADMSSKYQVMAIAPDVFGNTGIETVKAIKAYVNCISPDLVIAVDSLKARHYERLASTVQISDGGIIPGSGVGNSNTSLSEDTLSVPVLSIGVPTVVSSSTLIYDAINNCGADIDSQALITMLENGLDFLVALKEADILVKSAAMLISDAINSAFTER